MQLQRPARVIDGRARIEPGSFPKWRLLVPALMRVKASGIRNRPMPAENRKNAPGRMSDAADEFTICVNPFRLRCLPDRVEEISKRSQAGADRSFGQWLRQAPPRANVDGAANRLARPALTIAARTSPRTMASTPLTMMLPHTRGSSNPEHHGYGPFSRKRAMARPPGSSAARRPAPRRDRRSGRRDARRAPSARSSRRSAARPPRPGRRPSGR